MQYGELRSDCGTRFVKLIFWIVIDVEDTFETVESFLIIFFILIFFTSPTVSEIQVREREDGNSSDISPVQVCNLVDDRSGQPEETTIERDNSLNSEIPEWLQEFREILVDDEIPLQGGSHASSSHETSLEPTFKRREDLGNHSVYTHFPQDRNCEICKRSKITRAPCRRRNGEAVPLAEKFGDLITADHKVLSDKSRNNHRYAVVVQDLATQWIQAYPRKTKTSHRNPEKIAKVPGTREESESHLHWQFLGIRQSLWRSLLESLHVYTTQIGDQWYFWKSSAQSKKKVPLLYCCNRV